MLFILIGGQTLFILTSVQRGCTITCIVVFDGFWQMFDLARDVERIDLTKSIRPCRLCRACAAGARLAAAQMLPSRLRLRPPRGRVAIGTSGCEYS